MKVAERIFYKTSQLKGKIMYGLEYIWIGLQ